MTTTSQLFELVYRTRMEDQVSRGAAAAAAALRDVGAAAEITDTAVRKSEQTLEQLARRLDPVTRYKRDLARAEAEYERSVKTATQAVERDAAMQEKAAAVIQAAAVKRVEAERRAEEQLRRAQQRFADFDAQVQRTTRTSELFAQSVDRLATPFERMQAAQERIAAETKRLEAQFRPMIAINEEYRRKLEDVAKAQRLIGLSDKEAATERAKLADAYERQRRALRGVSEETRTAASALTTVTSSTRLNAQQLTQLSYQINDVFVGLASGQSPMMVLVQQGPQVTQALGGVRAAISAVTSVVTPFRAGLALAAGGFAAMLAAAESTENRLASLRNQLRGYQAEYAAMAREIEASSRRQALASPGFGLGEITGAQGTIAQALPAGGVGRSIAEITELAKDLSRTLDGDLGAAATRVARALRDPAAVARELADQRFPGMTEELRRTIEVMQLGGDRVTAFNLLFDRMRGQISGAAQDMSPLREGVAELGKGMATLWDSIRGGLEGAGERFLRWLTESSSAAARLREESDRIGNGPIFGEGRSLAGTLLDRVLGRGGGAAVPTGPTSADVLGWIQEAARATGLDPALLQRVQAAEGRRLSDGSWAVSSAGARGPMQVMPGTFAEVAGRYGISGGIDDPRANVLAGAYYLRDRLRARGDVSLALADYNAGPGTIDALLAGRSASPMLGVRNYVSGILSGYSGTGFAGAGSVPVTIVGDATPGGARSAELYGPPSPGTTQARQNSIDGALAAARGLGLRTDRAEDLNAVIQRLSEAQSLVERGGDTWRKLQEGIDAARGALLQTEGPVQQFLRGQRQTIETLQAEDGAAREVAEAMAGLRRAVEQERGAGAQPTAAEAAEARRIAYARLSAQYEQTTRTLDRQIQSESRVVEAMLRGTAAGQQAESQARAAEEVRRTAIAGTSQYAQAVADLAAKYDRLAQAQADRASAQQVQQQRDEIELIQREVELLTASVEVRERELAALRARQDIVRRRGDPDSEASQALIRSARDLAAGRVEAERYRNAFQEIQRIGEQAFDRIGAAITEMAVQGRFSMVSLANVGKAVASELIQAFARLAIINPIINAVFGGNRATLGTVSALVANASAGTSSAGLGSLIGGGNNTGLGSVMRLFSGSNAWYQPGYQMNLGLGSGINSILNTPVLGSGLEMYGPASAANPTAGLYTGGATIGQIGMGALGILGGGFGVYQGLQTGGARGAAQVVGGAAGIAGGAAGLASAAGITSGIIAATAAWAPYIAAAAALVAAFLPAGKKGFSGGDVGIGVDASGMFNIAGAGGKRWNAGEAVAAVQEQIDGLNKAMQAASIRVQNAPVRPNGYWGAVDIWGFGQSPWGGGDPRALWERMRPYMVSDNPNIERMLRAGQVTSIEDIVAGADWIRQVYEPLTKVAEATSSWNDRLKQIHETFGSAIDTARRLGLAETELVARRDEALQQYHEERNLQIRGIYTSLDARGLSARAALETDPTKALDLQRQAALLQFDFSAETARRDFRAQLEDLYINVWDPERFAALIAQQEEVLAQERLAIIKQFTDQAQALEKQRVDQAQQAVTGLVVNLADYAAGLRIGDASPLSPRARFEAAERSFNAVAGSAAAGDFTSVQRLQSYADAYLELARDVYGGGAGYAEAFERVLEVLERVGNAPEDELTRSAQEAIAREQTEILRQELSRLRDELRALRAEFSQGSSAPARAA